MFSNDDRILFDNTIEKIVSSGDKIGKFLNITGKWIFRKIIVFSYIFLFGVTYFICSIIKRAFGGKNIEEGI